MLQHTSYVGHDYYKRIKPLAMVERGEPTRPVVHPSPLVACGDPCLAEEDDAAVAPTMPGLNT